jgi:DNA helicase-2/ATP-dependent DNA helicase PcrA
MLVVAGAGTGKTTVLTRRIVRLIREGLARPDEVLALTYTENAASEMRERVQRELRAAGANTSGLQVMTFHAYCNNLLIRNGRQFGVLDDKDFWIFLRKRLRELKLKYFVRAANVSQFLDDLLDFMRRCQDELVTPEKYADYVRRVGCGELPVPRVAKSKDALPEDEVVGRCQEIASVFITVEDMLREKNLGTFGHMITKAHDLLQADPALLAVGRQHARFILVDEFQDANFAQVKILQNLAGPDRNVFAVGDPDQAIYRFRGASSAAFALFQRQFPDSALVALDKNRRSTTPILQTAFALISNNPEPFSGGAYKRAPLISAREEDARREGRELPSLPVEVAAHGPKDKDVEAFDLVSVIRQKQRQLRAHWSDFAVLYRTHTNRDLVAAELTEQEVPFSVENMDCMDTPDARDLLACAGAVASFDGASLFRVAALPQFQIDPAKLRAAMRAASRDESASVAAVLREIDGGAAILDQVEAVRVEIARSGRKGRAAVDAIVKAFHLNSNSPAIAAVLDFVTNWEKKPLTETAELAELVEYLDYFREAHGTIPLQNEPENAVRLMTAHAAKGLEFNHVFIIRANSGSFPASYKESLVAFPRELRDEDSAGQDDSKALNEQEERRLFYVAMTRARDTLTMYAKQGTGKTDKTPAGFLRDLLKNTTLSRYLRSRTPRGFQTDMFAAEAAPVSRSSQWLSMPPAHSLDGRLSASAIERYETCPLQFKLERDWHIPRDVPGALHYGAAMHVVLRAYYDSVRAGRPHSEQTLIDLFRTNLADAGINDQYQFDLYERQGIQQLKDFLAACQSAPAPEVLHTEETFEIRIGKTIVAGRIDRIDETAKGVVITDYKTGKPRSQEDADESLQLSIYAIAAAEKWGYRTDHLAFYNLEGNAPVITSRSEAELFETRMKVEEVAAKIAAGKFDATPGFHCRFCPYRNVCPATEKRLPIIAAKAGAVEN